MARQAGVEHVNQFITDQDGRVAVIHGVPAAISKQIGANVGDTHTIPVYGMSSIGIVPVGVNLVTLIHEVSFDGGSNWAPQQVWFPTSLTLATTLLALSGFNGYCEIPPGCTHFRSRVTIAAADNTITLAPSAASYRANQVVTLTNGSTLALSSGGARIGVVTSFAQGALADETTTPLAGSGTFTGAIRDVSQISSGAFVTSSSAALVEFRTQASADVAGTLAVEISADQVTWWRIATQALAAVGSIFYAQLNVKPVTRYARAVFTNGAGAQSAFLLSTGRIGG